MARAATTSDAFNAVAEPRRREILDYLILQERPVGDIVAAWDQTILCLEALAGSAKCGIGSCPPQWPAQALPYQCGEAIKPLHEWTKQFERFWQHQLNRIKERAEGKRNPG